MTTPQINRNFVTSPAIANRILSIGPNVFVSWSMRVKRTHIKITIEARNGKTANSPAVSFDITYHVYRSPFVAANLSSVIISDHCT